MSDTYFMLWNDDGEVHINKHTKASLLKEINSNTHLNIDQKFQLVNEVDSNLSGYLNGFLIIKGESIKPHQVMTVTEYDVE